MNKNNKYLDSQTIFVIIMIIIFIIFIISLCFYNKDKFLNLLENFGFVGEIIEVDNIKFVKKGYGPAIDDTVMTIGQDGLNNPWNSGATEIQYKNHEGLTLYLTGAEFRSINGFIPPSFEYFPFGINKSQPGYKEYKPDDNDFNANDYRYNGSNIEEGRQMCLQACKDTGCIAVQTEVPQLCYDRRTTIPVPDGLEIVGMPDQKFMVSKNDCKDKATHGCTLFYKDIVSADDGYYILSGGEDKYNDPTVPIKIGEKYYEQNRLPDITPGSGLPSTSTIKFCDPEVTEGGISSRYKTKLNATSECTCSSESECSDSNCCLYRDLLTTKYAKYNMPYYNLPLNLTRADDIENYSERALCNGIIYDPSKSFISNLFGVNNIYTHDNCCGYCLQEDGSKKLVSCPGTKRYIDGTYKSVNNTPENINIYWHINTSQCAQPSGGLEGVWGDIVDWFEGSNTTRSDEECVDKYKELYNTNKSAAYDELTTCCTYLDQACQTVTVQPYCKSGGGDVIRGCFSNPPILNVDKVTEGGLIKAADDTTVIPSANRCIENADGVICKAFPYGVSEKSGSLWIPLL